MNKMEAIGDGIFFIFFFVWAWISFNNPPLLWNWENRLAYAVGSALVLCWVVVRILYWKGRWVSITDANAD